MRAWDPVKVTQLHRFLVDQRSTGPLQVSRFKPSLTQAGVWRYLQTYEMMAIPLTCAGQKADKDGSLDQDMT